MKIEHSNKDYTINLQRVDDGEAFVWNDDVWIKLPKYDYAKESSTVFKDTIYIPAWNVIKNYTTHFTVGCAVTPVNAKLVIQQEQ